MILYKIYKRLLIIFDKIKKCILSKSNIYLFLDLSELFANNLIELYNLSINLMPVNLSLVIDEIIDNFNKLVYDYSIYSKDSENLNIETIKIADYIIVKYIATGVSNIIDDLYRSYCYCSSIDDLLKRVCKIIKYYEGSNSNGSYNFNLNDSSEINNSSNNTKYNESSETSDSSVHKYKSSRKHKCKCECKIYYPNPPYPPYPPGPNPPGPIPPGPIPPGPIPPGPNPPGPIPPGPIPPNPPYPPYPYPPYPYPPYPYPPYPPYFPHHHKHRKKHSSSSSSNSSSSSSSVYLVNLFDKKKERKYMNSNTQTTFLTCIKQTTFFECIQKIFRGKFYPLIKIAKIIIYSYIVFRIMLHCKKKYLPIKKIFFYLCKII